MLQERFTFVTSCLVGIAWALLARFFGGSFIKGVSIVVATVVVAMSTVYVPRVFHRFLGY
jgi:hypothetical protein